MKRLNISLFIIGSLLFLISIPLFTTTVQKFLYQASIEDRFFGSLWEGFGRLFSHLYLFVYSIVPFEEYFLKLTPYPNFIVKTDIQNTLLLLIIILPFIGIKLIQVAMKKNYTTDKNNGRGTFEFVYIIVKNEWHDSWWGKILITICSGVLLHLIISLIFRTH